MNYSDDELELYGKAKNYGRNTGNGDTLYDMTVQIPVNVWITVKASNEHEAISNAADILSDTMIHAEDIDDYDAIDGMRATVVETRRA